VQLRDAKSVKMEKENLLARVEAQALELANHDSEALKAISLVKSQAFEAEQEKEELYLQFDRVSLPQAYMPLAAPSYTSVIGRSVCVRRRSRRKSDWRRTSSASTARTKSSPLKVKLGSNQAGGWSDTPPVVPGPAAALGPCCGTRTSC
jgi:hypothetical protein